MRDIKDIQTGRIMYMKHADGSVVEYVQWSPELVEQHIFAPLVPGRRPRRSDREETLA